MSFSPERCREGMQACAELIADARNDTTRKFYMALGRWWAKKLKEAEAAIK